MDVLILMALILLNGLFAMSEIALVSARNSRLQKLADKGDSGAANAIKLKQDPTRFLSTVQIGITTISLLNGIYGEAALAAPLAEYLTSWGVSSKRPLWPQLLLLYWGSLIYLLSLVNWCPKDWPSSIPNFLPA